VSSEQQRLFAVRGATQVENNEAGAILAATEALMKELIARNELQPEALVSCLFTTTDDLDAEFPAVAARRIGLDQVPLLCCREIPVPGSMPHPRLPGRRPRAAARPRVRSVTRPSVRIQRR
jgi:chorismate mutase